MLLFICNSGGRSFFCRIPRFCFSWEIYCKAIKLIIMYSSFKIYILCTEILAVCTVECIVFIELESTACSYDRLLIEKNIRVFNFFIKSGMCWFYLLFIFSL